MFDDADAPEQKLRDLESDQLLTTSCRVINYQLRTSEFSVCPEPSTLSPRAEAERVQGACRHLLLSVQVEQAHNLNEFIT